MLRRNARTVATCSASIRIRVTGSYSFSHAIHSSSNPIDSTKQAKSRYTTMADREAKMPLLELNDGTSIPMLGYGTGTAMTKDKNDNGIDRERVEQIKTALSLGYYHLDGAEMYNTEREIGVAIRESGLSRDKVFVTTKVWTGINDIHAALNASLEKMQLEYVDLYLIHGPFLRAASDELLVLKLQEAWADMESLQAAGKTRSIGVSNYLQTHLETTLATAKVVPSINQTEFHPYLQRGTLPGFCKSKGIAIAAYAPLTPVTKAKPGPCDEALAKLAAKYGVSEGDVCLRWCIDKGIVGITTSSREQRLAEYLRSTEFQLERAEVEELDKAGQEKHFRGFWTHKFSADSRL